MGKVGKRHSLPGGRIQLRDQQHNTNFPLHLLTTMHATGQCRSMAPDSWGINRPWTLLLVLSFSTQLNRLLPLILTYIS